MLKRAIWLCLAGLVLACSGTAHAQMEAKGMIIRAIDRLVYIDLGRRDGVQAGDLFDVVSADVLLDRLSGDTLAVSPESVGAIRVRQVFDKMAIAELMHIQAGQDPMLMKIARIQDPERLIEIEQYMQSVSYGGMGDGRMKALVPGLYQYKMGQRRKGFSLMVLETASHLVLVQAGHQRLHPSEMGQRRKGFSLMVLETASLVAGIAFRLNSNDWKEQYDSLNDPQSEYFDYYFDGANDRRRWSNRFFWLSGALYAFNLIDVLWAQGQPAMSVQTRPRVPFELGMGMNRSGQTMLQVVHRF